eukprot:1138389-Pelagomonas_calceolata.AAC.2
MMLTVPSWTKATQAGRYVREGSNEQEISKKAGKALSHNASLTALKYKAFKSKHEMGYEHEMDV